MYNIEGGWGVEREVWMGGGAGAWAEATVDQPLPRRDHTVYCRATVMFEAAVIIGIGTDDFAYFVMGEKREGKK